MTKQCRVVVSYPIADEQYHRAMAAAAAVGVGKTKLIHDALTIAFLFQEGKLEPGVQPEGVACFRPRKRRTR